MGNAQSVTSEEETRLGVTVIQSDLRLPGTGDANYLILPLTLLINKNNGFNLFENL